MLKNIFFSVAAVFAGFSIPFSVIAEPDFADYIEYTPPTLGGMLERGPVRGACQNPPEFEVLLPRHTAQTQAQQPVLYWWLSALAEQPFLVSLAELPEPPDYQSRALLNKKEIIPQGPGIQRLALADYQASLLAGKTYKLTIMLDCDSQDRSSNPRDWGKLFRIPMPAKLSAELAEASANQHPYLYARNGFWPEALHGLQEFLGQYPANRALHKARLQLLEKGALEKTVQALQ